MSTDTTHQQTLALAGVAQFVLNAHDIAAHGHSRPERVDAALCAVFCTDPDDAADVVGYGTNIRAGVTFLRRQFGRSKPESDDPDIARNMGQVLRLTGRLLKRPETLIAIRAAIDRARLADADQAPSILDEAYQTNISPIPPRIMVRGHPSYLNNPVFEQRVRTHLLAAVRCAVLWRHCGGRFWRLVVMRRQINESLAKLDTQPAQPSS